MECAALVHSWITDIIYILLVLLYISVFFKSVTRVSIHGIIAYGL